MKAKSGVDWSLDLGAWGRQAVAGWAEFRRVALRGVNMFWALATPSLSLNFPTLESLSLRLSASGRTIGNEDFTGVRSELRPVSSVMDPAFCCL